MVDLTRLADLVSLDEELHTIADGLLFTEGPVWHPTEHHLTFSDIPANRMYRWDPDSGLRVWREPSNHANGNAYDRQGRLITCEHATGRVVPREHDGTVVTLAGAFNGTQLNSPNDVVIARDGAIYFTDPVYGRTADTEQARQNIRESIRGVYRLVPESGDLALLVDDCVAPNGLCLSGDEHYLFVNDSERGHIRRFDLAGGGVVAERLWATPSGPEPGGVDGMKVDALDNLYRTGPGGVWVYTPTGQVIGVIPVPEEVANFAWGGEDLQTMYFCARTSVYTCRTNIPGLPAF